MLNYIEKGAGFPLVFLHGNGENSEYLKNQIDYFCKEYRVIAPDTRGHGKSERGDGDFNLFRFSRDLGDFLDCLKIDKAVICGYSDGANVAMLFAVDNPERVEKLVLCGGNLFPEGLKKSELLKMKIGYKINSALSGIDKNAMKKKELLSLMVNEPHISPESLKKITAPTLVLAGEKDVVNRSHTELIYKSLPNAELKILKGDHYAIYKRPAEFNEALEEFLSKR